MAIAIREDAAGFTAARVVPGWQRVGGVLLLVLAVVLLSATGFVLVETEVMKLKPGSVAWLVRFDAAGFVAFFAFIYSFNFLQSPFGRYLRSLVSGSTRDRAFEFLSANVEGRIDVLSGGRKKPTMWRTLVRPVVAVRTDQWVFLADEHHVAALSLDVDEQDALRAAFTRCGLLQDGPARATDPNVSPQESRGASLAMGLLLAAWQWGPGLLGEQGPRHMESFIFKFMAVWSVVGAFFPGAFRQRYDVVAGSFEQRLGPLPWRKLRVEAVRIGTSLGRPSVQVLGEGAMETTVFVDSNFRRLEGVARWIAERAQVRLIPDTKPQ